MKQKITPSAIDTVVASHGGVGTTLLLSYLSQYKHTNHTGDADGLKHASPPPTSPNTNAKYIYIYGDPKAATLSLFRRNFHFHHSMKLQRKLSKKLSPIPRQMTLDEYASAGTDLFYFKEHFSSWYATHLSSNPIMFVKYETLFENINAILDFLAISTSKAASFPAKKERTCSLQDLSAPTMRGLNRMYGGFAEELRKLQDVEFRRPTADA